MKLKFVFSNVDKTSYATTETVEISENVKAINVKLPFYAAYIDIFDVDKQKQIFTVGWNTIAYSEETGITTFSTPYSNGTEVIDVPIAKPTNKSTKLWILTQNDNNGYDTYDSCVVAADTEDEARQITPGWNCFGSRYWANSPESVIVEYLGETTFSNKGKVIISSFNAG